MTFNIYELIDKIRLRPALYIGNHSVTRLNSFLHGYVCALHDFKIEMTEKPQFHNFHDWVAMRLNRYEGTSGWCNMLLKAENGDEEKALERFFVYLDEFKQRQAKIVFWAVPDATKIWHYKIVDIAKDEQIAVPPPPLVQIVKYNDDKGVFIRYIGENGEPVDREMYCQDLDDAFSWTEQIVEKDAWKQGDRQNAREILAKAPDVEPEDFDKL